ncbi:hypothetical protein AMATHDRAFT_146811 [Amanita thiersii Skay4041]|uniref:Solute carrier family 40 member n=1 Tax=Amanita thiersii Skay4041 TaxID=703135 RepID=A0A2A9NGQ2_9AGAR|nr:hypothetical protein AMATHDRAFT_146811 [Amanita thiersii Skay4041]
MNTETPLLKRLYISHSLSTWNSRSFEFGATLFLATIFPGTLLPTSVYALTRSLSAILFAPTVGRYIDTHNRLEVVRLSIVLQRVSVALSCVVFWYMLADGSSTEYLKPYLLVLLALLACVEKLFSIMNTVSVERDWVVVIAHGDEVQLRVLNSMMRRIDLFCKLIGPLAISLVDGYSAAIAILVTLSSNVLSVIVEYYAIAQVYNEVPTLRLHRTSSPPELTQLESNSPGGVNESSISRVSTLRGSLSAYFNHPVVLPSLALALLYFTVLSFSGQMVTYLLSLGFQPVHIALARIVSVAFEISATWLAPVAMAKIGSIRAGLWFINWQITWVTIAVVLFLRAKSLMLSAMGLVGGVILSRVGLWGFDLCAQVIIQEHVGADSRGAFSSIEASLQHTFELCSYISTIIFAKPEQFKYPVLMSPIALYLAGALFAMFVRDKRGHLLHIPKCFEVEDAGFEQQWLIRWEGMPRYDIID